MIDYLSAAAGGNIYLQYPQLPIGILDFYLKRTQLRLGDVLYDIQGLDKRMNITCLSPDIRYLGSSFVNPL